MRSNVSCVVYISGRLWRRVIGKYHKCKQRQQREDSPGQLEAVHRVQRQAYLYLCAALWLDGPLGLPLGQRLFGCSRDEHLSSAIVDLKRPRG